MKYEQLLSVGRRVRFRHQASEDYTDAVVGEINPFRNSYTFIWWKDKKEIIGSVEAIAKHDFDVTKTGDGIEVVYLAHYYGPRELPRNFEPLLAFDREQKKRQMQELFKRYEQLIEAQD